MLDDDLSARARCSGLGRGLLWSSSCGGLLGLAGGAATGHTELRSVGGQPCNVGNHVGNRVLALPLNKRGLTSMKYIIIKSCLLSCLDWLYVLIACKSWLLVLIASLDCMCGLLALTDSLMA